MSISIVKYTVYNKWNKKKSNIFYLVKFAPQISVFGGK